MSGFAPKFCPTHLKIHVCELQNVTKKVSNIENDLGAKVRRLHGIQTEEERLKEEAKRKPQKGTLGDILARAKEKIKKEKEEYTKKTGIDSDTDSKPVTQEEISDRMASLRRKMLGGEDIIKTDNSPIVEPITTKKNKSSSPKKQKKSTPPIKEEKLEESNKSKKLFTEEETQELIQNAVKEALKKVGYLNDTKLKTVKTTSSNTKKTTKPQNVKEKTTNNNSKTKSKKL